jgi:hypothetical protein
VSIHSKTVSVYLLFRLQVSHLSVFVSARAIICAGKILKVCSCEKDKSTVRAVIIGTGNTLPRALFILKVLQNFGGLFPGGKIVKNYFDGKHQRKNYDAQNPRLAKKT